MRNLNLNRMLLASVFFIFGCSSGGGYKQEISDTKFKQEQAEGLLDGTPDWYFDSPADGQGLLFSVGHASDTSLDNAFRNALLKGELGLAKKLRAKFSALEKSYSSTQGQKYQSVIESIVSKVKLGKYKVAKKEIVAVNGNYNVFVLLSQQSVPDLDENEVSQAFDELSVKINE